MRHVEHETELLAAVQSRQERVADRITAFAGSMRFVWLHIGVFVFWCSTGLVGTDPFPFNFLTLAVSLEAIFLATFVMISQNREAKRSEIRAQLDYETNVHADVWTEAVGRKFGVDPDEVHAEVARRLAAGQDA